MTTLQMPPARRRAHRNQPVTTVIPVVFIPATAPVPAPVLQRPPIEGLRYHAGLGHRVTTAMLAERRQT